MMQADHRPPPNLIPVPIPIPILMPTLQPRLLPRRHALIGAAALLAGAGPRAQPRYPDRPIPLVVPFGPGV